MGVRTGNGIFMGFPWEWEMSWIERGNGNENGNQARLEWEMGIINAYRVPINSHVAYHYVIVIVHCHTVY